MDKNSKKINTKKYFLFNLHYFFRYALGGEIVPMTGALALAFVLLPFSVLFYLFLFPLIIMMAYKLAFDVLAQTAQGNMKPEMRQNYLVTNAVAIKVFVLAIVIEIVLWKMQRLGYSSLERSYFLIVSAFVTPAIYMSLALTNSLLFAINPINIVKIIKITHLSYLGFVLFWISTIVLHEQIINPFVISHLPIFINGVVSTFIEYTLLVVNFHIMGYILFQYRKEFDLADVGLADIDKEMLDVETIKINPAVAVIKDLLQEGESDRALAIIINQQKEGDNSPAMQNLYKQAMDKKMYQKTDKDIAVKINNQLRAGKLNKAFNSVIQLFDAGKEFFEISPTDIGKLVDFALNSSKSKYIAFLVKDFHIKYPYHEDIVPNYFALAKVLYKQQETKQQSALILKGLIEKYPHDSNMSEIKSWYKGVQMMAQKK